MSDLLPNVYAPPSIGIRNTSMTIITYNSGHKIPDETLMSLYYFKILKGQIESEYFIVSRTLKFVKGNLQGNLQAFYT
jgi:hypothetical protein